jgi:hypothetical protein
LRRALAGIKAGRAAQASAAGTKRNEQAPLALDSL